MTGICGFLGLEDRSLLKKMCSYMKHRGNIIDMFTCNDLSLATVGHGEQPKLYYDERIIMTMDQDIYAVEDKVVEDPSSVYSSLRSNVSNELSLIKNLRGSFSLFLAEINGRVKRAILARDIYGTRSLYYLKFDNALFFASEMKCFSAIEDLKLALNTKALNFYLTCGFSPTRETIIKNVYKLLPAEIMEYNDGVLNHTIYWSPKTSKYGVDDLNYWAKATFITLLHTTKMLLPVKEKKLGIALSGGLDSSLIAALIRQVDEERRIISFSLDYGVEDGTELKAATEVAEYLNLERHVVQLDPERVVRDLEALQWMYDEPMIKFTFIPTYYILKDAKKYVKTIFTGDGGDELFIGYRRDYWEDPMPIKIFAKLPNAVRKSFLKLGTPSTEALANATGFKTLSLASEFFTRESASHPKWQYRIASRVFQGYFAEDELPKLLKCYNNSCNVVNEIVKLLDSSNSNNSIEKTSHAMIMRKLPDDLLRLDKAVAATAVKARSPLLDPLMTNFALSIPIQLKYCSRTTKSIIRYVIKRYDLLPAKIADVKGKRGLTAPLHYWLSRTCIRDYVDNLLESDVNFLDAKYVKKIWPPKTYTKALKAWNLAALLLWLKTFPGIRFSQHYK
jgi:asparagine synthase (glutamine-hydrolysing)